MTTHRQALPTIDTARCTGCGWCVAVCAPHVLSLQVVAQGGASRWGPKRSQLHDAAGCTGCALCAVRCPFDAIRMVRTGVPQGRCGVSQPPGDDASLSHTGGAAPVV